MGEWEGSRWRHRVTDGVIEVVDNFYETLRVMELRGGSMWTITRTALLQDYRRLDTD